jgi:hypothetical protein
VSLVQEMASVKRDSSRALAEMRRQMERAMYACPLPHAGPLPTTRLPAASCPHGFLCYGRPLSRDEAAESKALEDELTRLRAVQDENAVLRQRLESLSHKLQDAAEMKQQVGPTSTARHRTPPHALLTPLPLSAPFA